LGSNWGSNKPDILTDRTRSSCAKPRFDALIQRGRLVPDSGGDLGAIKSALAGALISITLNPAAFRLAAILRRRLDHTGRNEKAHPLSGVVP
jgi:hypothetical protein